MKIPLSQLEQKITFINMLFLFFLPVFPSFHITFYLLCCHYNRKVQFAGHSPSSIRNICLCYVCICLCSILHLSPNILMSGPVMCMTDGCSASGDVSLITSARPWAACSFSSGWPLRIASRNTGNIGAIPCNKRPIPLCYCTYEAPAIESIFSLDSEHIIRFFLSNILVINYS